MTDLVDPAVGPCPPDPWHEERLNAFILIKNLQAGDAGALLRLRRLVRVSEDNGRSDLLRVGLFGLAVHAWMQQADHLPLTIGSLIARSEDDRDPAMLAVGLSMRSSLAPDRRDPASSNGEMDLARASVILEGAGSDPLGTIAAHTACGIAFDQRSLWELGDEQYDAAFATAACYPGAGCEHLLPAVAFNRAENQVAWAAGLRQLGDMAGAADVCRSWESVAAASNRFGLPPSWKAEIDSLGLLVRAIAGEDVSSEVTAILPRPDRPAEVPVAYLKMALALSDTNAGRAGAAAAVEDAIAVLNPALYPHLHHLALFLAAELEAKDGPDAGMRCLRYQLTQGWEDRLSKLSAMETRIEAERLILDHARLAREVTLDHLTGVGNRRALDGYLNDLRDRRVESVAVIMTDIDHFKDVNDRFGHHSGDAALARIGAVLGNSVRPTDRAVRLGGDEFMIVVPDIDLERAQARAERIMAQIDEQPWELITEGMRVTVSIGVAVGRLSDIDLVSVRADAAAYQAKAAGGHTIVCHRQDDQAA